MSEEPKSAPKTLLSFIVSPVLIGDRDDTVVYLNPAAQKSFSCKPSEALGAPIRSLFDEQTAQTLASGFNELRAGRPEATMVVETHQRIYNVTASPISGEKGVYAGALTHFVDITAERSNLSIKNDLLSAVVNEVMAPVRYAVGVLKEAAASIAHPDFANAHSEERMRLSKKVEETGGALERARVRLAGLVDIGAGDDSVAQPLVVHKSHLHLADALNGALHSVASFAAERKVKLVCLFNPKRGRLFLDAEHLNFVLINLLSFAIHQSPAGSEVSLWTQPLGDEGAWLGLGYRGNELTAQQIGDFLSGQSRMAQHFQIGRIQRILQAHAASLSMECLDGSGTGLALWLPAHVA